jgi:hypothetical protein
MRRKDLFLQAVFAASALSNRTPLPEVVKVAKRSDPERLTKAQKKRERKAAQRLKLARV